MRNIYSPKLSSNISSSTDNVVVSFPAVKDVSVLDGLVDVWVAIVVVDGRMSVVDEELDMGKVDGLEVGGGDDVSVARAGRKDVDSDAVPVVNGTVVATLGTVLVPAALVAGVALVCAAV